MLETLLVEDDDDVRDCIAASLEDAGHHVTRTGDGACAATLIDTRRFDLMVCDVHLPNIDGLTLVRRLRRVAPATSVVVMTSHARVEDVVEVMRGGAVDYVTKPFDPDDLVTRIVGPIAERRALRRSFERARAEWGERRPGAHVVAESRGMRLLVERLAGFARSDVSVLLEGERGTGKKTLARLIHEESPRRDGPFVVIPCATLAVLMAQSDLWHLAGSDMGKRRDSWFQAAEGGTLVLDGIDQLSSGAQAALARVLGEPGTAARRGDDWQPRGVRVISTSQSDLLSRVTDTGFLEPLYFRTAGAVAHVPPLRDREGDLLPLVAGILAILSPPRTRPSMIEPSAIAALSLYPFEGNVAELVWALECALLVADAAPIEVRHLPPRIGGGGG